MIVQLFEPKAPHIPLHYGDVVEVTFTEDYSSDKAYYILNYNDELVNFDGGVRYSDKCVNISEVIKKLNDDKNIASWRVLSKNEYTVQIHKNTK
ncbi:hypothetical protein P4L29_22540 [Bacillus cereus]|nr:hypothetical protein [Bacillus cereus]